MAVDMFLKIDGIKGESKDSKHKDEIDVLAWSWGLQPVRRRPRRRRRRRRQGDVQDMHFTKYSTSRRPTSVCSTAPPASTSTKASCSSARPARTRSSI